jgi:hypothetical protein
MFNKLVSNIKGGAKKSEDDDDDVAEAVESEKGGEDDEKKKKKSMAIKVVVILGLAYLAVDTFFLTPDKKEEVVNIPAPKKRKKPKKELEKKDEVKPSDAKVADAKAPDTANTAVQNNPQDPPAGTNSTPPVENINIEKSLKDVQAPDTAGPIGAMDPQGPVMPSMENAPATATNNGPNPEMDKAIGDLSANLNPQAPGPEVSPEAPKTDTPPAATAAVETATEPAEPPAPAFNEPYAPPPNYEELGRGLVYNCKEGHWSCVNRLAYVACNKNTQWNRSSGKAPECVVQNIFKSDDDCGKMQRYYVANNKETSFCK